MQMRSKSITVDLNCDLGESFGVYRIGQDQQILPFITSANIACGFHAGDPQTMNQTVAWAKHHHVQIGAHPSLPDLPGFGRRKMEISPEEIYHLVIYQLGSLAGFARIHNTKLHHVKPHGALYNMSASDPAIAEAIAEAVYDFDANLILFGLAKSYSTQVAHQKGLRVAEEVFADRTYQANGRLTPRTAPQAIIKEADQAIAQVIQMLVTGTVTATNGETISIQADTVCIHGDHIQALEFVKQLRAQLEQHHIDVQGIR